MSSGHDLRARRRTRLPVVAAGTALALLALVVVTTAGSGPILQRPDRNPDLHLKYGTYRPTTPAAFQRMAKPTKADQQAADAISRIVLDVVVLMLLLGLLWLVVVVARSLLRRWRSHRKVARAGPLPMVDDAVLDALARATGHGQQLLAQGAPSDAIVACWLDLEQAVAAAGVRRRPSETSAELTLRVLDVLEVDRRALRTLGALYRQARFSQHPASEAERTAAGEALEALHRSLPKVSEQRV